MPAHGVRRGQVWRTKDDSKYWLVVSTDSWNSLDNKTVIGAQVVEDEPGDAYSPQVSVGGVVKTIWIDTLQPIEKVQMVGPQWTAPAATMAVVDEGLDRIVGDRAGRPKRIWPPHFPRRGQFRHVDLQIPGENAKPHIVVSNDLFADDVSHAYLVLIRAGSDPRPARTYEVALTGGGKAVCCEIRTVPADQLIRRRFAAAVTGTERSQITAKVRLMLGLSPIKNVSAPVAAGRVASGQNQEVRSWPTSRLRRSRSRPSSRHATSRSTSVPTPSLPRSESS